MREYSGLILSDTFTERLAARDLLIAGGSPDGGNPAALRDAAANLEEASARFDDATTALGYMAFAGLVRIVAYFVEWRRALLNAEPDPDRFKRSALTRLALWQSEFAGRQEFSDLAAVMRDIHDDLWVEQVSALCQDLARIPLPLGVYGDRPQTGMRVPSRKHAREVEDERPPDLNVAFLSFTVDGEPARDVHTLTPHEMHDLEIEVRVARWPTEATELHLTPVSIEPSGAYDLPEFVFNRPEGEAPFIMKRRGRAMIKAAQALRARAFEFLYVPEFSPKQSEQPVAVVGHRLLRIESIDVSRSPLTGYRAIDEKLLDVRNTLRRTTSMPQADVEAAMTLAVGVASLAGRALQSGRFSTAISEKAFQELLREDLRQRPEIGSALEERPRAGGGETDLSFHAIRLELKVEPKRNMALADCQRYVEQAAAYAVGSGKRVAVLCVLDASPKQAAGYPAEDCIGVLQAQSGIPIVTILVQGGFPTPSSFSR